MIDSDGSQRGIVSLSTAKSLAAERNLDLVKVADESESKGAEGKRVMIPAVCKIIDYGKYMYEMSKKEKESRKRQRNADIKEIRISLNIDENDLNTKVNQARNFAESGDKIRVVMRLKGREANLASTGKEKMLNFANLCSEFANMTNLVYNSDKRSSFIMNLDPKSKNDLSNVS